LFNNYIDLLPNEALNFETIKDEISIKSKTQNAKIKGISSDEFPIIPLVETKEKFLIEAIILKNALEKIIFSISPSEIRAELSGALFSFNKPEVNKLTIVGTDSYRLTEKEIPVKGIPSKTIKNLIIPVRTLQEVLRMIKDKGDIEVCLSENQILFVYKGTELISRVINGEYPDYKQTIPQAIRTKILIKKEEFLRTVKAASFFTKLGINDINLKFLAKENQLIVSSLNSQIGENKATLPAEIVGENNEIVFNYRYLIDGLTNLSGDEVILEIVNDDTPGLIRSTTDKHYLYLIMPIKNN